jgi:hypothetical protein
MLQDDLQHLGQTRGVVTIAEHQSANRGIRWPSRHPVFANKDPGSPSAQLPNLQMRALSCRSVFDIDWASLRWVNEILPTQHHRTFQNAVDLNSYHGRSAWDALHGISFPLRQPAYSRRRARTRSPEPEKESGPLGSRCWNGAPYHLMKCGMQNLSGPDFRCAIDHRSQQLEHVFVDAAVIILRVLLSVP